MKSIKIMTAIASLMATTLACDTIEKSTDTTVIGKQQNIAIENGRMSPEVLWAMGRIGSPSVSPDGKKIAYTVSYYSIKENKGHTVIYVMNADGSENKQLTTSSDSENSPAWIKEGSKLAFLTNGQVWEMNPDGTERCQLTDYKEGIDGFAFSPDEKKLLFISQVKTVKTTAEKYPDLPKASGIIVDDLMYKHWDEWVTTAPHPFVADFDGRSISNVKDILEGEPYESPMKPFGGIEQLAWSPSSDKIAYTCRKKTGLEYSVSTDSDIYLYNIESKETRNLCKEDANDKNMGYDTNPLFSPDGTMIAWQSMERDGYESDRNRLCVYNIADKKKKYVTETFDSNVDSYCWAADSKRIYFTGCWHACVNLYHTDINGNVLQLTDDIADFGSISLVNNGNKLLATRHSMSQADELYIVNPGKNIKKTSVTQLTYENQHIYDQLQMGEVRKLGIKTTDGKDMRCWLILPPHFDETKKYPTLLYCEGGPQSPVSQFWSYRWNFQIMAAHGYVIVAPNRRGLPGFGSEWNEEISGDWTGQCMKDYLSAIDYATTNLPYVDKDRLGAVGASFGGFSVYYLAGHHDKRFKCFIAHDGAFNLESMYTDTEEAWFSNWEYEDAYWNKNLSDNARRTYENSPHRFVDKWDTPILCIHGEKDYRINANQGFGAFNAARMKGIPAELLIFPDENHWVLKPQNGILWQRTFFNWLDRWLKK